MHSLCDKLRTPLLKSAKGFLIVTRGSRFNEDGCGDGQDVAASVVTWAYTTARTKKQNRRLPWHLTYGLADFDQAKEWLAEFWRLEKEAEKLLEGVGQ